MATKRKVWSGEALEQLMAQFRKGLPKVDVAANIKRIRPGTTVDAAWSAWVHHSKAVDRNARRKARKAVR